MMKYYIRYDDTKIDGELGWLAVPHTGSATWVRADGSMIRPYRSAPTQRPSDHMLNNVYHEVYAPGFLVMCDPDLIVAEGL